MRRKFLHLLVALITFLSLYAIGRLSLKPSVTDDVVILQDGWYVRYNETEFENVKLSDLRRLIGNGTFRGDRIRFTHENVDLSSYRDPTIMFETRFSSLKVYLNERKVEQKFTTYLMRDKFIGCENNFVILPESSEPVSITIELEIAEDGAYGFYDAPVIGRYEDVFKYEIYQHIFIFTVSAFLIVFGFIFFLIGLDQDMGIGVLKGLDVAHADDAVLVRGLDEIAVLYQLAYQGPKLCFLSVFEHSVGLVLVGP